MKIVYILPHASRCGGVKVIAEHVVGLCKRGHAAEVWGLSGDFNWFGVPVHHRKFSSTVELGNALRSFRGAKVATFWITASWVASNLLPGERGFYLIQDEDELTYSGSNRGSSYKLGLVPVTEGEWVSGMIQTKYDTPCHNVGIGYDPVTFRPLPMIRVPYRILTPYRPTSAGPGDLKGWGITFAVLQRIPSLEPRASVVTFGMENPPAGLIGMPHIHVKSPSDLKLRELYSSASCFLTTTRHEGFGLPHLEAMACGCPVVCTDANGNREHCRDGETASVHTHTDIDGMARSVCDIMTQSELAQQRTTQGYAMADRYRWSPVIDNLLKLFQSEVPTEMSCLPQSVN